MALFHRIDSQKGQILLVVVLAAVISLTVGLSVASRVITNTKVAKNETDSQKALSAAEAGIDQKLKTGGAGNLSINFGNNSSVLTKPITLLGSQILVDAGSTINRDDGADIWLSDYGAGTSPTYANPWSGDIIVYWKDNSPTDCTQNAAIEIAVISGSSIANSSMARYAFDSCTRTPANSFTASSDSSVPKTISGITFDHSAKISIFSGYIARIVPLYANTIIAIEGYQAGSTQPKILPAQGTVIESVGTAGNATRKVKVFQGYPKIPTEYFPYSLFLP